MRSYKQYAVSVAVAVSLLTAMIPLTSSADNPIVQTMYTADGAPMVYNDMLYMYTGHDEGNSGFYSMNDWRCFSSTDMQNWTDLGSPLAYTDFSWAKGEAWAAQCVERDGKFYYYVTVTAKTGGRAIGVAVADKPEGPFKDAIGKPLVGPMDGMKCIDPTVFIDDDGQAYLYFGNGELRYVLLNDDMVSCKGEPVVINTKNGAFGAAFDEAPYLYKRGGKYYMIYASDWLPQKVSYSVSDSPTGPWTFGKVIMQHQGGNCGTNHPGIVDYKGKTYLTYHDGNLPGGGDYGRSECVDEIIWNADGSMQEVKRTKTGPAQIEALDAYKRNEAETICYSSGLKTEMCSAGGMNVCDINNGEYIKVAGVDFGTGARSFMVSASSAGSGGKLEIRLDKQDGRLVGTCEIGGTGGWQSWKEFTCDISGAEGKHDLYFTISGGSGALFNMDWWSFIGVGGAAVTTPITQPQTSNIKLITNLIINDKSNAADWSVQSGISAGAAIYGDRDITAVSVPGNLSNAEMIRTACDSKLYTGDLGSFTAGADMTAYVAVDTRVNGSLDWLKAWKKGGVSVTTSNDVELELFKLDIKAGETVVLGTNGGSNESANLLAFAVPQEKVIKGDVNCDGVVDAFDVILARQGISVGFMDSRAFSAADTDDNEEFRVNDLVQLQSFVLGKTKKFDNASLNKPQPKQVAEEAAVSASPKEYMAEVSAKILNSEPSGATAENAGTKYGTYKKETIYSDVCKRSKSFNVLIPANYDKNKKYPVLYVLHGYWGDEDALLDKGDASLRLRQIIGNAIASGEAEDMIVVFPDIYASATQDKCDGLNDKNNAAYDNFINLLVKEIMPYMEKNYSIKTGRDNTAITGFSMGGRESLYIGLTRPDLFGYIGAMCPAPGVPLSADKYKFDSNEPYLFLISAGSNDTLIYSTPEGYHNNLTKNNTTHIWHYVNGGDHGGKTIRPHVYNFVRYIFKADK